MIVSPGYFELDSIVQISNTIREVQEYFNPTLELEGILFTMSKWNKSLIELSKIIILANIKKFFGYPSAGRPGY